MHARWLFLASLSIVASLALAEEPKAQLHWFKGNTHTHSLWSDGNDFPEMISDWYASHGYDFLAISDHNILARGEMWRTEELIEKRKITLGKKVIDKYRARFGDEWVQTRTNGQGKLEVRLRPLAEYRGLLEKPGKFLLIEAEELTSGLGKVPVHINAVNLPEVVPPIKEGSSIRDIMRKNLQRLAEAAARSGQPVVVHVNHPNFQWAITAEDLAHVVEDRYFEVFNGHPKTWSNGDAARATAEHMWDIANTIRLAELHAPILYGMATDDSHHYHGGDNTPGRGWVMVHAARLEAKSILEAMLRADFYASSGVILDEVGFDKETQTLHLKIHGEPGVHYHTVFHGTRRSYDTQVREVPSPAGDPNPIRLEYSADVGKALAETNELEASYQLTGDELYVRATITSDAPHPNPAWAGQVQQAWIQPVGWEKWVK